MRGWSLAIVMGLALAGCGPETEEGLSLTEEERLAAGDTDAQDPDATVEATATAYCKMPFPESSIPPGRKWDPPNHYGVDFPRPRGTAVGAVAAGKVVLVSESGCLGRYVVVKHSHDGKFSAYSHLSARTVKVGAKVKKGGKIGEVGTTGSCSTGNHLHLTMSKTDTGFMHGDTMDPVKYIHGCD